MNRTQVLKNLHPVLVFDKVDESKTLKVKGIRKDIATQFGNCDMVDFIDENGEIQSIFMGAALRLFDWIALTGQSVELVYKGKVKNKTTKRSYDDFEIYTLSE